MGIDSDFTTVVEDKAGLLLVIGSGEGLSWVGEKDEGNCLFGDSKEMLRLRYRK